MYSVINIGNYDLIVGLDFLNQSRDYLKNFIKSRAIVITDENVDRCRHKALGISLDDLKIGYEFHVIKPGEFSKCIFEYEKITNYMSLSYHKNDTVITFGGGVVGNLAGFVATTFMRGIDLIRIPTTVLSMVDSSVGSKTGISLPTGKNLTGAFKDPALCIIDPLLLKTLDDYVFEDGFGEIIKYAICFDEDLFDMISSKRLAKQSDLSEVVEICVSIKKDTVLKDKLGQNLRRLLNYGHTLGHAVEKLSNYSVMHEHGVAYGMKCMAKKYSKDYDKILEVLEMYDLDNSYDYSVDNMYDVTLRDKKNTKDMISLIISEKTGDYTILSMNKSDYKKVLSNIYED